MDEMADDYRLPSQRKAKKDLVKTAEQDLKVLELMYAQMHGYRWRAKIGWLERFGPSLKEKKTKKQESTSNDKKNDDDDSSVTELRQQQQEEDNAPILLSDPCRDSWTGITCDTKSRPARIFAIDLSNNGLAGEIPHNVGNLTSLRTITLSNNRIQGTLPESFGACDRLEYFSVEINQIHGRIPQSFGRLRQLKWLSLYNNHLSGHVPKEILRLGSLTHVFLQQNRLEGERPIFSSQLIESYQHHQNQFTIISTTYNRRRNEL